MTATGAPRTTPTQNLRRRSLYSASLSLSRLSSDSSKSSPDPSSNRNPALSTAAESLPDPERPGRIGAGLIPWPGSLRPQEPRLPLPGPAPVLDTQAAQCIPSTASSERAVGTRYPAPSTAAKMSCSSTEPGLKPTLASPVARFTEASLTPGTARRAFSTRPTHPAQWIPSTGRSTVRRGVPGSEGVFGFDCRVMGSTSCSSCR